MMAMTKDPAMTKRPTRDCQIFSQALAIFLGSPPAPINMKPAIMRLIKA